MGITALATSIEYATACGPAPAGNAVNEFLKLCTTNCLRRLEVSHLATGVVMSCGLCVLLLSPTRRTSRSCRTVRRLTCKPEDILPQFVQEPGPRFAASNKPGRSHRG